MTKTIEYFLCLNWPWTYLGQRRLEEIAARANARIDDRPVDLKAMMLAHFGEEDPPERSPAHRKYGQLELRRWSAFRSLPLNSTPRYYPVSQRLAARAVIAAKRLGADAGPLVLAISRAVWAEDRDIADRTTIAALADQCGIPGDILLAAADDPDIEDQFQMNTEEALARDIFGIPTYVYQNEIFWGQDRLEFLGRALAA